MKAIHYFSAGIALVALLISCTKDEAEPGIRLAKIIETTYAGSTTLGTFHYNTSNQLVEIKNTDYNQKFAYDDNGKLVTYEQDFFSNYKSYVKQEYKYENGLLQSATYIDNKGVTLGTTVFFYDAAGNIKKTNHHSENNLLEYTFECKGSNKISIRCYPSLGDTNWYNWDASGNLVEMSAKARNFETGGYETYTYTYSYHDCNNYLNTIPYPATYLFIRSLNPCQAESSKQFLDRPFQGFIPISKAFKIDEVNSQNYPVKVSNEEAETSWELVYETY